MKKLDETSRKKKNMFREKSKEKDEKNKKWVGIECWACNEKANRLSLHRKGDEVTER